VSTQKKETQAQIAARLGITRQALHARRKKWGDKRAEATPKMADNPRYRGVDTITARCARLGLAPNTYYSRRARGLSPEEAFGVDVAVKGVSTSTMLSNIAGDPALTPRIHAAIDATKVYSRSYWDQICAQRDPRRSTAAGSVLALRSSYQGSIEDALRSAEWAEFEHKEITKGVFGFRTFDLQGQFGIVDLRSIPKEVASVEKVLLIDPKETGFAEAQIARPRGQDVAYVTILLGASPNDPNVEIVWTFFPGPPISPSQLANPGFAQREVTVAEAVHLGLQWAKCVEPWGSLS